MSRKAERRAIDASVKRIIIGMNECLDGKLSGFWLYGSAVMDDFRPGWSDIDFIAFAHGAIGEAQAERLLELRQRLVRQYSDPLCRLFEGVTVSLDEFRQGAFSRLVYWGTSGQRVMNVFELDPFARFELVKYGRPVLGDGDRGLFTPPEREELTLAVKRHLEGIRRCARQTDESLYSCGWLLDIARCIYTIRFNDVISKTRAGEWALSEHIFPNEEPLVRTLEIRRDPLAFSGPELREWLAGLGPTVQEYADVLEKELVF